MSVRYVCVVIQQTCSMMTHIMLSTRSPSKAPRSAAEEAGGGACSAFQQPRMDQESAQLAPARKLKEISDLYAKGLKCKKNIAIGEFAVLIFSAKYLC